MTPRFDHHTAATPRSGGFVPHLTAAVALLTVVGAFVLTFDVVGAALFGRSIEVPFACRAVDAFGAHSHHDADGTADRAVFNFEGAPIFTIFDRAGHASILDRSRPVTHRLNQLWMTRQPIVLRAVDTTTIEANGAPLVQVLPGDLHGRAPAEVAAEWTSRLATVLRAHGRTVSIER